MSKTGKRQSGAKWPTEQPGSGNQWAPDSNIWFQKYIFPVNSALWRGDSSLAQEELDSARKAISEGVIDGEDADCLDAQLTYSAYQIRQQVLMSSPEKLDGGIVKSRLRQCIEDTLVPKKCLQEKTCYQYQVRLYILACCSTDFIPPLLNEEAFASWQSELEGKYKNNEFWNYIACWAYIENYLVPLEQAYDYMITEGAGFLSEFVYTRTELMLKLRRGLATDEDVLDLMKLTTVKNQLKVLKAIFFAETAAQGLWTPEVDRFYEDLLLELSHNTTSRQDRIVKKSEGE